MRIFAWAVGLELRFWVIEDSLHYNYLRFEQPFYHRLCLLFEENRGTVPRFFQAGQWARLHVDFAGLADRRRMAIEAAW